MSDKDNDDKNGEKGDKDQQIAISKTDDDITDIVLDRDDENNKLALAEAES